MNPWTQNIWMLTNVVDEMGGLGKECYRKKKMANLFAKT